MANKQTPNGVNQNGAIGKTFIDQKSVRNFAGASSLLTLLMNAIMIVYGEIRQAPMSEAALAILAAVLCVGYSFSFMKKELSSTVVQFAWLGALNSAILFSSLTGANALLKKASDLYANNSPRSSPATKGNGKHTLLFNIRNSKVMPASFVWGEFKYLIIPKQSWVGVGSASSEQLEALKQTVVENHETALKVLAHSDSILHHTALIQQTAVHTTDSLYFQLTKLRDQYKAEIANSEKNKAVSDSVSKLLADCRKAATVHKPEPTSINQPQQQRNPQAQQQQVQQPQQQMQQALQQQQRQNQQQRQQQQQQQQQRLFIQQQQQQQQQMQQQIQQQNQQPPK